MYQNNHIDTILGFDLTEVISDLQCNAAEHFETWVCFVNLCYKYINIGQSKTTQ